MRQAKDAALQAAYAARQYAPIWFGASGTSEAANILLARLLDAHSDGLDPDKYGAAILARNLRAYERSPDVAGRAHLDVALTLAAATFLADLKAPSPGANIHVVDPQAVESPTRAAALKAIGQAGAAEGLQPLLRMHPLYESLRDAAKLRLASAAGGPAAVAPSGWTRPNLERMRLLPANAPRHVLVDAASARLWLYEGRDPVDTMAVVVGQRDHQTPLLAGMIRYAAANPYWNVPPDLVRHRLAPVALTRGPAALASQDYEALSDWTPAARPVDLAQIDWTSVAAGRASIRLRQRPGPRNMLGRVKFMLPNRLGIYLHDTPEKSHFRRTNRRLSAGCVRVEDASRLANWLFGETIDLDADYPPETRLDLPRPVPVHITYLTANPTAGGWSPASDPYGLDERSTKA